MVIYSKKLRNILIDKGFKESKKPERNVKDSKYFVFFFEDSEELSKEVENYKEGKL